MARRYAAAPHSWRGNARRAVRGPGSREIRVKVEAARTAHRIVQS
jgi:hypothetical protein